MPGLEDLPGVNACLNAASAAFLLCGYAAVRGGRVPLHRLCMSGALACSALFLAGYLTHHARVGSVPFQGRGLARQAYLAILATHSVLAALVLPMALRTAYLALRGSIERHRRLARWTLPIWLYVSMTGIVVYVMLYRVRW